MHIGSHPTWVRGLKHAAIKKYQPDEPSHPTWVRGLKQLGDYVYAPVSLVAPYVGAWIETYGESKCRDKE